MTRREAWISAGVIFLAALAVRAVFAAQIAFPIPEDTAWYVGVARNMLEGRGAVSDALWSYATPPFVFPRPAFEVWLPLPTAAAALPMLVLGTTFAAAQVSSVLIGAVVPVLAWRLAADIADERGLPPGRARTLAIGTGLTTALYLPLLLHSALPDSTMPFTALALVACLLMTRLLRDGGPARPWDRRIVALGLVIGLAALTRNEAIWIGLTWAILAWRAGRLRQVVTAGIVAVLVFVPWMVRDWLVFGSPFPGQAISNALSISPFDIFAWNDPPTLSRYLAVGPARLLEMRVDGFTHNLLAVLVLPGLPISVIGLLALPWQGRGRAIRPLVVLSLITFAVTTLVFPVSTTWGTYLHAAGPAEVLIVVSALLALDAGIARLAERRGWTRPVAWLGPTLGIVGSVLFSAVLLPSFAASSRATAATYEELASRMAAIGHPLDATAGPVITDHPIWLAEAQRIPTLALPDEMPSDVLDLARDPAFPGTRLVIVLGDTRDTGTTDAGGRGLDPADADGSRWPAILDTGTPGAACFRELDLGPGPPDTTDPLAGVRAFEIVCP